MYLTRNRKCIIKLARTNFKNCKIRNRILVLAIILTTILFTTLLTSGIGAYESIQHTLQKQKGSKADAEICYMAEEQFSKVVIDERISTCGLRRPIGYLSNSQNHNIELNYMDAVEQDLRFSVPTVGTAPVEVNEIATTDKALKSLGVEPEVGAEVEIEVELRGQMYKYKMVVSGWWEADNSQVSIMLVSDKFMQENDKLFAYTFETDREYAGTYFADIILKENTDIRSQLNEIVMGIGGEAEDVNATNYIASSVNQVTNPALSFSEVLVIVFFALLFVFAGYLLISNIFEISVLQEVKRYGLLKTIGTTQKQIRFYIQLQAIWLIAIALPWGLLLGYSLGVMALPFLLRFIINEYPNLMIRVSPNPIIFVLASFFAIFTVLISTRKPADIAAKISPIEALRYSERGLKLNQKKHIKKMSLFRLALSSVKRNGKRSVFIIISMILCCILFNSTFIIANSIDVEKVLQKQSAADVILASGNTFNKMKGYTQYSDALDEGVIEFVKNSFEIKDEGIIYKNTIEDVDTTIDYGIRFIDEEIVQENGRLYAIKDRYRIPLGTDKYPICNVYGCNENILQRCTFLEVADSLTVNELYEKLKEGNYVIEAAIMENGFQCELGQTISIHTKSNDDKEYTVIAQMYVSPTEYEVPNISTGIVQVGGDAPFFYFSEEVFKEIYNRPTLMSFTFNVKEDLLTSVNDELEKMTGQSNGKLGCSTILMLKESMVGMKNTVYIIGGFIGAILGATGFINFINLMITNIISRKKEHAIMQSVGMTTKQIKRMLLDEGMCYALVSSTLGVLTSSVLGNTIIKHICNSIWFMSYKMVLWPVIILSISIIILSAIIPTVLFRTFDKESIVEKLRKDI